MITAPDTMMKMKMTSSVKKSLMGLAFEVVPPIPVGVAVTGLGDGDVVDSTVGCKVVDIVVWLVSADVGEGVTDTPPAVDKLALCASVITLEEGTSSLLAMANIEEEDITSATATLNDALMAGSEEDC